MNTADRRAILSCAPPPNRRRRSRHRRLQEDRRRPAGSRCACPRCRPGAGRTSQPLGLVHELHAAAQAVQARTRSGERSRSHQERHAGYQLLSEHAALQPRHLTQQAARRRQGRHRLRGALMSLRRSLYRSARLLGDVEAVASGDPKRITRRARNKVLGRALGRSGFWRFLWR